MKYILLNNVHKIVTQDFVNGTTNQIKFSQCVIDGNEVKMLELQQNNILKIIAPEVNNDPSEQYIVVLPEFTFTMFDKYGSNVIYSQQAFNYFYTKSPFIEYTGSHKNITIVAGTITWQSAKKEGTYFNTCLVFSSGEIIMSWDKQSVSGVDYASFANSEIIKETALNVRKIFFGEKAALGTSEYITTQSALLNDINFSNKSPRIEVYRKKFIVVICMDIGIYVRGNVINTDEQLIVVSSDLGISSYFAENLTEFASIIYCSESKPEAFTTMSSNPQIGIR